MKSEKTKADCGISQKGSNLKQKVTMNESIYFTYSIAFEVILFNNYNYIFDLFNKYIGYSLVICNGLLDGINT